MTRPLGARLNVEVLRLSPGDIAKGARELVDFERASLSGWAAASGEDREHVRTVVRAALLRLIETDHWLPGSVQMGSNRLDVRLTIEFDADAEILLALAREQLTEERARARTKLLTLMRELEVEHGSTTDGR